MLKVKDNVDLKELEKFGFHSFKVNRLQTNYYRVFSRSRHDGVSLILVNNLCRDLVFDKWYDNDTRIHKVPKLHYKDKSMVEDCLFDLTMAGVVEKVESV